MSRSSLSKIVLAVLVLAASTPVRADLFGDVKPPEMKYGPVELHPYAKFSEMYDSNIYLQPESKAPGNNANANTAGPLLGSWIHTAAGGLAVAAQFSEMHRLDLGYDAVYKAYSKNPSNNNTVNQGADGMYTYKGPNGISGHLKDTYVNTVDPATSELTQRVRRWQNAAGVDVNYAPEGGVLSFGADAGHTVDKYVSDPVLSQLLNRYTQQGGVRVGYQVMPQTRVYVAYHRQVIHYTAHPIAPTKNSKAHLVDLGVEGQIAPKLTGQIQGGLMYREYDDQAFVGADRVIRNWMVATRLQYLPIERTKIGLSLSRSLQEATFGNNQYYIASAAGLIVSYQMPYKVVVGVNGGVEVDQYPEATNVTLPVSATVLNLYRRDDIYQVGASVDYPIQDWLKVGASYLYRTRYSRGLSEQFNYKDHQTAATVSLLF